jgi:hypothetical protein
MIEGDARDEGALIRALDGCDAVVSSLGTGVGFREVSLLTVATRALGGGLRFNATSCRHGCGLSRRRPAARCGGDPQGANADQTRTPLRVIAVK